MRLCFRPRIIAADGSGHHAESCGGHDQAGRGQEEDMHPEYVEKAPRGAGWYILLEDGTMLEGGPYPSEEATWAEIALREPKEEADHGRLVRPKPPGPRCAKLGEDDC
jgi:hypothetical protein